MKFTLLALALAAIATANPIGEELYPRKAAKCTNGIVDPSPNSPCTYNVTCGTLGTSSAKPVSTSKQTSLDNCLTECGIGNSCSSVNYDTTTEICSLYKAATFTKVKKNRSYDSAVVFGCG